MARVARETVHAVDVLFPQALGGEAPDDVARAYRVGEYRTVEQDAAFGVR